MNWTIKSIFYINGWLLTFLPFALGGRLNETSACLGLTAAASSYLQNTFGTSPSLAWGNYDGRDLKICTSRSALIRGSCCSKQHEQIFLDNAFTITSRYSPKTLSDVIKTQSKKVSEQVHSLLDQTKEKARYRISTTYRVPEREYYFALSALFRKLSLFISESTSPKWTPISPRLEPTRRYIETFFRELFPPIFMHHLSGSTTADISNKLRECLKTKYDTFQPRPFRDLPVKYGRTLHAALSAYQTLLGALKVSADLVNLTTVSPLSPACLNGLIRLRLCHLCAGQNVSRPCAGVCLNVHRGCFAHLLPLRRGWKEFVRSTRALVDAITARNDLEGQLRLFDRTILSAVRQATYGVPTYGQQVITECMHAATSVDSDNKTDTSPTADTAATRPTNVEIGDPELKPRLNVIRSLLTNNQLFFDVLPDQFCKGLRSRECWNGTHQSRTGYSRSVLNFSGVTQPVNPEVQMQAPKSFPTTEVENHNGKLLDYSKRLMNLINTRLSAVVSNPISPPRRLPVRRKTGRGIVVVNEGSGGSMITGLPVTNNKPIDDEDEEKKTSEMSGSGGGGFPSDDPVMPVPSPSGTSRRPQKAKYETIDDKPGSASVISQHGFITAIGVLMCFASRLLVT